MPGVWDLLPSQAYLRAVGAPLLMTGKDGLDYSTMTDLLRKRYDTTPLDLAKWTHSVIDNLKPSVPMLRIVGHGHSTLSQVRIKPKGATRFVPGSHRWLSAPEDAMSDLGANYESQVLACGPSGSLLIFNGSVWHDHSANTSDKPRRSLQGAFIPRDGQSGCDFTTRMQPETRARRIAELVAMLGRGELLHPERARKTKQAGRPRWRFFCR